MDKFEIVEDKEDETKRDLGVWKEYRPTIMSSEEAECVRHIEAWINSNTLTLKARTDQDFIMKFLLGCKMDLDKTKTKIVRYYELRKKYPQWYKNRDLNDPQLASLAHRGLISGNLREAYDSERQVVQIDLSRLKPDDDVYGLLKLSIISVDTCLLNPDVQRHGLTLVLDLNKIPLPVIVKATPKFWYRFVKCVLMGMPLRVKGIHLINTNQAVMAVIRTFKLFLTEKLKKRVHVYGKNWETLFDHVPRRSIADEYGGTGGKFMDGFEKFMEVQNLVKDYFIDDEKYGFTD